jgi:hypothetical protein
MRGSLISSRLLQVSFDLTVVLLTLLAMLPAKRLITVETSYLHDQIQTTQDETDLVGLVRCVGSPQLSGEALYLVPDATISFSEFPVVSSRCYRGPPVLS